MANTAISDLKPPMTLYRNTNMLPETEWLLTAAADIKPGCPLYQASATTVDLADDDGTKMLMGFAGWKHGQELDTAYANGESIPVILVQAGLIIPSFIADIGGNTHYPGHFYRTSDTEGLLKAAALDFTESYQMIVYKDAIVDDDTVAWFKCV